jgi:hypothetical protein
METHMTETETETETRQMTGRTRWHDGSRP